MPVNILANAMFTQTLSDNFKPVYVVQLFATPCVLSTAVPVYVIVRHVKLNRLVKQITLCVNAALVYHG